jgi:putative oxidoreductase
MSLTQRDCLSCLSLSSLGPRSSGTKQRNEPTWNRPLTWERMDVFYARVALGCAFLSAVADRFGLWGKYGGWGNFANFTRYKAQVNSFIPAVTAPFFTWTATVAETLFGILLILGLWRWVALGSAVLLATFGAAMAISFGLKRPLDYSVFSASGAALLLALAPPLSATHL